MPPGDELFRYPVPYQAILHEIEAKFGADPRLVDLLDIISPMLEERDRNLEDAIEHLPDSSSTFVVVADDGTGDFTSIKEAIEAQPLAVSNEAASAIWVKPGTYDDNGLGAVDLSTRRVYVFTPPSADNLSSRLQRWTFDGFTNASGTALVTMVGFALATGATEDWLQGLGTTHLRLEKCAGVSGRGIFGTQGSKHLVAIDCDLSLVAVVTSSTGVAVPSTVLARDSALSMTGSVVFTSWLSFRMSGGSLNNANAPNFSSANAGTLILTGTYLNGGGTLTSNFDEVTITGCVTDEDDSDFHLVIEGVSGSRFCVLSMAGNNLQGCDLVVGVNVRASVQGGYRTLSTRTIDGSYFLQLDTESAVTAITITNTSGGGDGNTIVASIRTPGGGSSRAVSIAASANNNVVLYSANTAFALANSDSGTGNRINVFAPAAHGTTHNPGGTDPVTTATPGTIQPDDTAAEGTATSLARSDHRHAITAATAGTIAPDDTAAEGSATSFARSDHRHAIAADVAGTIAPDDTATEGVSTSFSRADHRHAIAAAVAGSIQPDDAAAEGVSTSFSRADHTHGITAATAGTIQPDDTAAEGAATSFSRSDHRHAIAADVPVATGDSLSEGASTSFSRADHVHTEQDRLYVEANDTTGATLADNTETLISWDTNAAGNAGTTLHNPGSNPSRFTASKAGLWGIDIVVGFASNPTNSRRITIRLNNAGGTAGAIVGRANNGTAPNRSTFCTLSKTFEMAANDYLEITALQDSGGGLALDTAARVHSVVFYYIGPA